MKSFSRHSNVDQVRLVEVIEVRSIRGLGTSEDPVNSIVEYYSKQGKLLARRIPNDTTLTDLGEWKE